MCGCRTTCALESERALASPIRNAHVLRWPTQNFAKRLVLARPRGDRLESVVDAENAPACGACYDFCPPGVYEMRVGRAWSFIPECVIL
jgi:NAD-dependent dihydropyrimidine dehydrogenase PreA subunit